MHFLKSAIDDSLYLFVGAATGGGVVTEGDYRRGMSGNASDIGLMPASPSTLKSTPDPQSTLDRHRSCCDRRRDPAPPPEIQSEP